MDSIPLPPLINKRKKVTMTDKQKREERVAAALERIATTLEGILEIIEQGIEDE